MVAPSRNRLSRLAQPPKHHLPDPALATRILGLDENTLLSGKKSTLPIPRDGSLPGHLFESQVTLGIRVFAQVIEVFRIYTLARDLFERRFCAPLQKIIT